MARANSKILPDEPLVDSEDILLNDPEPESPKKTGATKAKKFLRGQQVFEHHLFELLPNDGKVNRSHNPNKPELGTFTHKHFFHSVNQRGVHQVKTEEKNRHFHTVDVDWDNADEDGNPRVTVGPAMRTYERIEMEERIREERPVGWEKVAGNRRVTEYDTHTHEAVYRGSEIIKERGQNKVSDEEAMRMFGMSAPDKKIPGLEIKE